MRGLAYVLTVLVVFGLGFWAYRENYATQEVLSEIQRLQHDIGESQVRLGVLRAEWAYLNRPDRLRELADLNFDNLGLLPLRPDQFGLVGEISRPPEPQLPITDPVDVSSILSGERP